MKENQQHIINEEYFNNRDCRDNIYSLIDIIDSLENETLYEMISNLDQDYVREILISFYKNK